LEFVPAAILVSQNHLRVDVSMSADFAVMPEYCREANNDHQVRVYFDAAPEASGEQV
jgi:hypothetical protein